MLVSVVIPTFRRQSLLLRCLDYIIAQNLSPKDYEIIIADDEGSRKTQQLVNYVQSQHPRHQFRYVEVGPKHGPAAARNCGWQAAQAPIIAFTDDDCRPNPNWLKEGLAGFTPYTAAVWGKVVVPLSNQPTDYEINTSRLNKGEFVTANCFCRKSALEEIGGFDERFLSAWREDSDLYFTLVENGEKLNFVPAALVEHPARKSFFGISVLQQRNNIFEALLYKKHRLLYAQKIPLGISNFYYLIVFSLVGSFFTFRDGDPWLAKFILLTWLILTAQFCWFRLKQTSRHPRHIFEMVVTSIVIPPVAIFWRLVGAFRYKVLFY